MLKKCFILLVIALFLPLVSVAKDLDLINGPITSGSNVQTDWVPLGANANGEKTLILGFSGSTINFRIQIQIKSTTGPGNTDRTTIAPITADFTLSCSGGTCTKTDTNSGTSTTVSNPLTLVNSNRIESIRFSYWRSNGSWDYATLQVR